MDDVMWPQKLNAWNTVGMMRVVEMKQNSKKGDSTSHQKVKGSKNAIM